MVYRWTDCPVLAGLELGDYDGYTLLDDATGTQPERAGHPVCGPPRLCWDEEAGRPPTPAAPSCGHTLTAGAVSTAAAE